MPAPDNLTATQPGESTTDLPAAQAEVLTDLSAADLKQRLDGLTVNELVNLRLDELDGKARTTVLSAIDDEIAKRRDAGATAPGLTSDVEGDPDDALAKANKTGRPVLTPDGWVVPEIVAKKS
jgi:hypothetical protein